MTLFMSLKQKYENLAFLTMLTKNAKTMQRSLIIVVIRYKCIWIIEVALDI